MNEPTLSYIVLAHGEESVFGLIDYLKFYLKPGDSIIVLNDPTTPEYEKKLKDKNINLINHKLDHDYSAHRNLALTRVKTDYFFFLDADELPSSDLMKNLRQIILANNKPDLIWFPRLNRYAGVKPIHALMFGWSLQGDIVNYPDYQTRLAKAGKGIKFSGALHERLQIDEEIHTSLMYPHNQRDVHILHTKNIAKQLADNDHYLKNYSISENMGQTAKNML